MTDPYDDPLGDLLTAARRDLDPAAVREAATGLARDVARRPRRRTRRRGVAIGLAALVVAVPGTAAAFQWTTHTGIFGDPVANTEDVDSSEILDLCAPDFPATARRLMPADLPLPAGATRTDATRVVVHTWTKDCRQGSGALMQATGVSHAFESYAWCSWVNTWMADPASRPAAADALHHYATSHLARLTAGDDNVLPWLGRIADAAERGDVKQVAYEQDVNCGGGAYGWRP